MDKKFFAIEISVGTEEQTMTIVWADEHRSAYSLEGLRLACPCVECAGGHDQMGKPFNPALSTCRRVKPGKFWNCRKLGIMPYRFFGKTGIIQVFINGKP